MMFKLKFKHQIYHLYNDTLANWYTLIDNIFLMKINMINILIKTIYHIWKIFSPIVCNQNYMPYMKNIFPNCISFFVLSKLWYVHPSELNPNILT